MKKLLFFLLLSPFQLWAQAYVTRPVDKETLKPISSDLIPGYGYSRHGGWSKTQYMYDGLDVRHPKDLGQYIYASGDPDAIREFKNYITSRHAGGWLIAGGILTAGIGLGVALANDHSGEATLGPYYSTATVTPNGTVCGGYCNSVPDRTNHTAVKAGVTTMFGGLLIAALGGWMLRPGQHFRRSVQYYNRALKQQGISWQLTPYATFSNSGIGLVGKF